MSAAEFPDNLQAIKLELPGTPEKSNIKERLNLHVKRRLQHELDAPASSPEISTGDAATAIDASKRTKSSQPKDVQKTRKPYQKRVEKVKSETIKGKKAQIASPAAELDSVDDTQDLDASPEGADGKTNSRDRFKTTDILSTVLSVKKRALMQNPEVQAVWAQIMAAIKS